MHYTTGVLLGAAAVSSITGAAGQLLNADLNLNLGGNHHQNKYEHKSCYTHGPLRRTLEADVLVDVNLTIGKCAKHCRNVNGVSYKYFGLENGRECYCDKKVNHLSHKVSHHECNKPCAGNKHQMCGAENRIDIYVNHFGPGQGHGHGKPPKVSYVTQSQQNRD